MLLQLRSTLMLLWQPLREGKDLTGKDGILTP